MRGREADAAQRAAAIAEVLATCRGKYADLGKSHAASRVLQTCVKFGDGAQRRAVAEELAPHVVDLARDPYGRFLVSKLLALLKEDSERGKGKATGARAEAQREARRALQGLVEPFKGRAPDMLRHPCACHVLDDVYAQADPRAQGRMVAEFYGPELALFGGGEGPVGGAADLEYILGRASKAQRATILGSLYAKLLPILEKGLVDSEPVHSALEQYLRVCTTAGMQEVVEALAGPHLLHIAHTRPGARAAAAVVAGATPKQRKKIVREMKGHVVKMATDPEACKVLLCVLSMVDDTVLVGKFVAAELAPAARELAFHKVGRRALLQLLRPNSKRYLPGDVLEALTPSAKIAAASKLETRVVADPKDGSDGEEDARDAFIKAAEANGGRGEDAAGSGGVFDDDCDDGADGAGAGAGAGGGGAAAASVPLGGKKDPELRRKELLLGKVGLGVALLDCCREHAAEMLTSPVAGDVLFEVLEGGGGVLEEGLGDQLVAARARVAELAAQPRGEEGEHPCEGWFSSRLLRRVVLDGGEPARAELWKQAFQGRCEAWLDTHAQKVLQAFVQCPDSPTRRAAVKELTPLAPVKQWQEPPPQAKGGKKPAAAAPAAAEKPAPVARKPRSKKKGAARS